MLNIEINTASFVSHWLGRNPMIWSNTNHSLALFMNVSIDHEAPVSVDHEERVPIVLQDLTYTSAKM